MKTEDIEGRIKDIATPVAEGLGMEIVDVQYASEHGRKVLRIFIDKPDGITVDDCADVSREMSAILDVEDPIPQSYTLEISSPGLDRPLTREKDFVRFAGKKVRIKTREPIEGRKNFKATIDGAEGGVVKVTDSEGRPWEIPLANIDKARLEIEI